MSSSNTNFTSTSSFTTSSSLISFSGPATMDFSDESILKWPSHPSQSSTSLSSSSQRKPSFTASHNASMRQLMKSWEDHPAPPPPPPQCQQVMFSSWTHFDARRNRSSEELKVSVLWSDRGTVPGFCPPLHEKVYLGVDQPVVGVGDCEARQEEVVRPKVDLVRRARGIQPQRRNMKKGGVRRQEVRRPGLTRSLSGSWETTGSGPVSREESSVQPISSRKSPVHPTSLKKSPVRPTSLKKSPVQHISFSKSPVQPVTTNSLLTKSFLQSSVSPKDVITEAVGEENLSAEMLPSVFGSDSEDEEEELAMANKSRAARAKKREGDKVMGGVFGMDGLTAEQLPDVWEEDSGDEEG